MKTLLALLISAASASAQAAKPPVSVPVDATHFNGKWYKVYLEKVTWHRAKEKCEAMKGQLCIVPDAPTWEFVKSLTKASVWLGATDEKTEGVWEWVNGTSLKYSAWFEGQPDNTGGKEHYLSTYKSKWNDSPKGGQFMPGQFVTGFICEWEH